VTARAAPIRVAVLDDHAAVRAGLEAILGAAPDMVSVGSAQDERSWTGCCGARTRRP
jgi:DNA-binding NarL/FixJ family response regulator